MRAVVETTANAKAGEGDGFFVSHIFEDVADAGKVYIRHVSGSTKYLHSLIEILTVGKWKFTSYAGTTYTANGTELEGINRKSDSPQTLDTTFYHTPTINVLGTPRLSFKFGGGTNPATVRTAAAADNIESVFAPNADVLIELTNESGTTQDISFVFNVHEEL